jgi:undecaprenyl-diphosphatase
VERSPADVLRLMVALALLLVLLLVEWLFGDTVVAFGSDLLRGLDAVPQWIRDLVVLGTRLLAVVVFGGGLVAVVLRRRWRMLVTVAIAALAGGLLAALLDALISVDEGAVVVELETDLVAVAEEGFPTMAGLGAALAVLTAAAPWMSRRWRRAAWVLAVGLVVTSFLDAPVSFEAPLGAVSGWLAGAAVLVALGAPSRRPTVDAVMGGLAAVGMPVRELARAGVDARGSTPYFGVGADDGRLFVKVLGDDERSADMLFRLYRRIQPRDFGDEKPFSSLRRTVEHEALVALAAGNLGVRTPGLRAFATVDPNGYVLAYQAIEGRSLDRLQPEEVTDEVLGAIWDLVVELRRYRIAHRDLRLANIFLDESGQAWLIDFGFSELAASDLLLANDVAELVASSSVYVGAERAVAHAAASVDGATLLRARDRLRPWALSGATRSALKARQGLVAELRKRLTDAAPAGATR